MNGGYDEEIKQQLRALKKIDVLAEKLQKDVRTHQRLVHFSCFTHTPFNYMSTPKYAHSGGIEWARKVWHVFANSSAILFYVFDLSYVQISLRGCAHIVQPDSALVRSMCTGSMHSRASRHHIHYTSIHSSIRVCPNRRMSIKLCIMCTIMHIL